MDLNNFTKEEKVSFLNKLGYFSGLILLETPDNNHRPLNISVPINSDIYFKLMDYTTKGSIPVVPSSEININEVMTNLVFEKEFRRCFLNMIANFK